jgi:hypothetical protein
MNRGMSYGDSPDGEIVSAAQGARGRPPLTAIVSPRLPLTSRGIAHNYQTAASPPGWQVGGQSASLPDCGTTAQRTSVHGEFDQFDRTGGASDRRDRRSPLLPRLSHG